MLDLSVLNKQQAKVVRFGDGPLMVIAGAGSGKTRCLTYRVAHLLERGVLPSRMMVTTFTTKATEEMTTRLEQLVGPDQISSLRVGTFHSLFYKIMRDLMKIKSGNYDAPGLIQDGGRFFVILNYLRRNKIEGYDIKEILKQISWWKNDGKRVEDVAKERNKPGEPEDEMVSFYREYERHLKEEGKIDFDDMLFKTYYMLKKKYAAKYLEKLRKRTTHILVDEGQDLNRIQYMLLTLLTKECKNITVVLDDWQVLYGFRGSSVDNVFNFMKEYNPTVIKLERNYRSTKEIVQVGNTLIKKNTKQIDKTLFTKNPEGERTRIIMSDGPDNEAEQVLDEIQYFVGQGYALNDIAILYRTNSQSRALVDILIRNDVPHIVHSNSGFYDRKEVKDIVAYLRIANDPHSCEIDDFKRILNKPSRYLGHKFLTSVEEFQIDNGYETFWEAFERYDGRDLHGGQFSQFRNFVKTVQDLNAALKEEHYNTAGAIDLVLKQTGYGEYLRKQIEDDEGLEPDEDKELNLEALMAGASRFQRLEHFLKFVEAVDQTGYEDEDDVVHLMTVHKAKGTEFPIVFVVGVSEGLMPHNRADDIEEERRIAYVAVTRAMEHLHVCFIHGRYNRRIMTASRFIPEMGLELPHQLGFRFSQQNLPVGQATEQKIAEVIPIKTPTQLEMFPGEIVDKDPFGINDVKEEENHGQP